LKNVGPGKAGVSHVVEADHDPDGRVVAIGVWGSEYELARPVLVPPEIPAADAFALINPAHQIVSEPPDARDAFSSSLPVVGFAALRRGSLFLAVP
jgi:hypothetical protein